MKLRRLIEYTTKLVINQKKEQYIRIKFFFENRTYDRFL
jgi:hypothetical protein